MQVNGYGEKLLLSRNGRMLRGRNAREETGDDMPIPHVISYASIISGAYHTYYHGRQDEAMRHAREDALVMQRDCFLMGLMEERMRHVSTLNWHLEVPDEDNPDQVLVRDHIKTTLSNMTGKDRSLRRIIKWGLWKTWFGRMGAQIKWKWENQAGLKTLTVGRAYPINGDKIIYRWSQTPAVEVNAVEDLPGAEYIPATNEGARALLLKGSWRNKFAIFTHDQEDSDFFDIDRADAIHGVGIRSKVFWLNWIRLEWESRVASFFDSLGTGGFLVFFFEQGNAQSEENVTEAAKKYSGFTKLVIPRSIGDGGAGVEFLPINMTGVDALGTLRDVIRRDIQRYIVGQEGSGEATSGGGLGNEASTEFRMMTKWKVAKDDSETMAEELTGDAENPSLVYMIQAYTFPDSVAWKPGGFPVTFKFDLQEENSTGKIEAATAITSMGVTLRADEVRSAGGFGKPGEGDETVGGKETLGLDKPGGGFGDDKKPDEESTAGGGAPGKKVDDGTPEQHLAAAAVQYVKDAQGNLHDDASGEFTSKAHKTLSDWHALPKDERKAKRKDVVRGVAKDAVDEHMESIRANRDKAVAALTEAGGLRKEKAERFINRGLERLHKNGLSNAIDWLNYELQGLADGDAEDRKSLLKETAKGLPDRAKIESHHIEDVMHDMFVSDLVEREDELFSERWEKDHPSKPGASFADQDKEQADYSNAAAAHRDAYEAKIHAALKKALLGDDTAQMSGEHPEQYGETWITIGGHEEGDKKHVGGFRVQIDGEGRILKGGPAGLRGKKVSEAKSYFEESRKKPEAAVDNSRATRNNVGSDKPQPTGDAKVETQDWITPEDQAKAKSSSRGAAEVADEKVSLLLKDSPLEGGTDSQRKFAETERRKLLDRVVRVVSSPRFDRDDKEVAVKTRAAVKQLAAEIRDPAFWLDARYLGDTGLLKALRGDLQTSRQQLDEPLLTDSRNARQVVEKINSWLKSKEDAEIVEFDDKGQLKNIMPEAGDAKVAANQDELNRQFDQDWKDDNGIVTDPNATVKRKDTTPAEQKAAKRRVLALVEKPYTNPEAVRVATGVPDETSGDTFALLPKSEFGGGTTIRVQFAADGLWITKDNGKDGPTTWRLPKNESLENELRNLFPVAGWEAAQ